MPAEHKVINAGTPVFEELLTLKEAANLLGIHWKTLEGQARRGLVPATKVGKRWRFRATVLDEWLTQRFGPKRIDNVTEIDATLAAQPRRAS